MKIEEEVQDRVNRILSKLSNIQIEDSKSLKEGNNSFKEMDKIRIVIDNNWVVEVQREE